MKGYIRSKYLRSVDYVAYIRSKLTEYLSIWYSTVHTLLELQINHCANDSIAWLSRFIDI